MTQYRPLEIDKDMIQKGDVIISYGEIFPISESLYGETVTSENRFFRPIEGWILFSDRKPDKWPCIAASIKDGITSYCLFGEGDISKTAVWPESYFAWLPFEPATIPASKSVTITREDLEKAWKEALDDVRPSESRALPKICKTLGL